MLIISRREVKEEVELQITVVLGVELVILTIKDE